MNRWGLGLCVLIGALSASPAQAQIRTRMPARPATPPVAYRSYAYNPYFYSPYPLINPNYFVAPGLTINQYAYNVAVLGQALSYVPPWAFGYNPYPQVVNYGPVFAPRYVYNPYISPYWNPVIYNPYANFAFAPYYYNPYAFAY